MTIREDGPILAEDSVVADSGNDAPVLEREEDAESPKTAQEDAANELTAEKEKQSEHDDINASSSANGAVMSAEERKLKHWKDSKFAVGLVNVTWKDDRPSWWCNASKRNRDDNSYENDHSVSANPKFAFSSIVCGCLGARRVGNMAVLAQSEENFDEEIVDTDTGQVTIRQTKRPKLLWVVGPYWTVNLFITFPLILGVSGWICYKNILTADLAIIITWSIGTFLMVFSLCMISCRDPGILYRHSEIPTTVEEEWRWNDQARTYRPASSRFDSDCQVVVEGFDHTCPWTGTAIGSKNMFWFKLFVSMVPIMLIYTVVLAAFGGLLQPFFRNQT